MDDAIEVAVKDVFPGEDRSTAQPLLLRLTSSELTVEQLIRMRVIEEVSRFNRDGTSETVFRGLVIPTEAEAELNDYHLRADRKIDTDKQVSTALAGFRQNKYVLLVNDRQAERLDETLNLTPDSEVVFLKLVPLVGG